MKNIHATCINLNSKGVLILGDSGSGKSDLALRLITMFSAKLVGDDRINIKKNNGNIIASSPDVLKGLLEVRGVGIIKIDYKEETSVDLVIKLTSEKIERMPKLSPFFSVFKVIFSRITSHSPQRIKPIFFSSEKEKSKRSPF